MNKEQMTRGRGWMPVVPQACFLYLAPIRTEYEKANREEGIFGGDADGMGRSKHGFLYSFNCLVRRRDESVPYNIDSGFKAACSCHLRLFDGYSMSVKDAAPWILMYLLWRWNHGMLPKGLHLYCQEEVGFELARQYDNGWPDLHPKFLPIMERLIDRVGGEGLNIIVCYPDDEKPLRREWYEKGRRLCLAGEHQWWRGWNEHLPMGWRDGIKSMTPEKRMGEYRNG